MNKTFSEKPHTVGICFKNLFGQVPYRELEMLEIVLCILLVSVRCLEMEIVHQR